MASATNRWARIQNYCRRFMSDRTGHVALTFSIAGVAITAMAGGAVDFALARSHDEALQHAADAAALESAITYHNAIEIDQGAIYEFFMANYATRDGRGTPSITAIEEQGLYTVTATLEAPTLFLGLIGMPHLTVNAEATAEPISGITMCVLLLEPREIGLDINSHAEINSDCGFYLNSAHAEAIHANSRSHMNTAANFVVGGTHTNSGSTISPDALEGISPMADPMANFPAPSAARRNGCDYTDMVIDHEATTIYPGIYCGLIFNSGAEVTMQPGIYVIRNGEFLINSLSSATAENVSIYLEGEGAGLTVNSQSSFTITPPRSGEYKGIAIFQSATVEDADIYLNSGSDGRIEGLAYAPNNRIFLNSHTGADSTSHDYMVIIARDMYLNSHSRLNVRMDGASVDLPDEIEAFIRSAGFSARLVR